MAVSLADPVTEKRTGLRSWQATESGLSTKGTRVQRRDTNTAVSFPDLFFHIPEDHGFCQTGGALLRGRQLGWGGAGLIPELLGTSVV